MKKPYRTVISLLLSLGVVAIGGYYLHQHWGEITALRVASPRALGIVSGSFVLSVLLRGLFTLAVLRSLGTRLSLIESFALSMVGTMANNLLPVRTGAGIRGLYLKRVHQLPLAHFASTMGAFYLINVFVAAALGLAATLVLTAKGGEMRWDLLGLLSLLTVLCLGCLLLSPTLPARFEGRVADFFRRMAEGWGLIRRSPTLLILALVSSVGASLFAAVGFYAGFYSMGISTSYVATILLTASYAVGGLVALTPGGVGIQEGVGLYFGSLVAVSTVELLSILLVVRFVRVTTSVLAGVPCLWHLQKQIVGKGDAATRLALGRRLARFISFALCPVERWLFGAPERPYPPVFIVGLPRSGSTLLYQTLCHCFDLAYSSRLTRYCWFLPACAAWWTQRFHGAYVSDFQSRYGKGRDWAMPYDATIMWNLWFGKDVFLRSGEGSVRARRVAQQYVSRAEVIQGGPFLERNLRCNQWLPVLTELFSDAVFLISLRDPKAVARSLLQGRLERFGDLGRWHLIRPQTPSPFPLTCPEDEVVYQVWGIVEDLRADMEQLGVHRFACVRYEHLCADPNGYGDAITALLSERGVYWKRRQVAPASFITSGGSSGKLSPAQEKKLACAVSRYFPTGTFVPLPCVHIETSR